MKQSEKLGKRNQVGAYGEEVCVQWLKKKHFSILEVNYLKKWGEIDIIAKKANVIHFVEVKTVSYETKTDLSAAISRGTYRPEENVHKAKLQRLNRTIESWLSENNWEGEWQIDVAAVRIVPRETYATIKYIDNVIM